MSQTADLLQHLKKALREAGLTYAQVGEALGLSEASVKRLFHRESFSLARLEAVCALMEMTPADLFERLAASRPRVTELSVAQEKELVADPRLFLLTYLLLNRWELDDILAAYSFETLELQSLLRRLENLDLVRLVPGGRIRLLTARNFAWRADGPVQRYIIQEVLPQYFEAGFGQTDRHFRFIAGSMSPSSASQIADALQRFIEEFDRLVERDSKLDLEQRSAYTAVMALRPFRYSVFEEFEKRASGA